MAFYEVEYFIYRRASPSSAHFLTAYLMNLDFVKLSKSPIAPPPA